MKTILLVEDDADLISMVKYNLEKEGYGVAECSTGKEVSELCRRVNADLMLLDVGLPERSGWDICREIRADPFLRQLPIIFLTARGSEADSMRGIALGANDYVTKPFSIRELLVRIRVQLRVLTNEQQSADPVQHSRNTADRDQNDNFAAS